MTGCELLETTATAVLGTGLYGPWSGVDTYGTAKLAGDHAEKCREYEHQIRKYTYYGVEVYRSGPYRDEPPGDEEAAEWRFKHATPDAIDDAMVEALRIAAEDIAGTHVGVYMLQARGGRNWILTTLTPEEFQASLDRVVNDGRVVKHGSGRFSIP